MSVQETNLSISEGDPFFAHEVTINFTPTQYSLDFKCITPRNDPRTKQKVSFHLKHNVVLMDPWHFKLVTQIMNDMVKKYETEFGTITKPKAIEKAEKKKQTVVDTATKPSVPTYFG